MLDLFYEALEVRTSKSNEDARCFAKLTAVVILNLCDRSGDCDDQSGGIIDKECSSAHVEDSRVLSVF